MDGTVWSLIFGSGQTPDARAGALAEHLKALAALEKEKKAAAAAAAKAAKAAATP